jgi:hypothetical protein
MTDTSRTSTSTSEPSTNTATEHYSRRRNENGGRDPRTTRSNAAHLGIVIIWPGPASGRPQPTLRAVDLERGPATIVPTAGWSSWC